MNWTDIKKHKKYIILFVLGDSMPGKTIFITTILFLISTGGFSKEMETQKEIYVNSCAPLAPTCFSQLPINDIHTESWLKEQMVCMLNGMTGNLDSLYPEVCGQRNGWLGGDGDTWERGPYWIDGLLPLAYILEDEKMISKVKKWVKYTLNSQRDDGYIGPRPWKEKPSNESGLQKEPAEDWWPRMVMCKILQSYYLATKDQRVIDCLTRYFHYQLNTLPEKPIGKWSKWAKVRAGDNLLIVLWLYNITKDPKLIELGNLISEQMFDYTEMFLDGQALSGGAYESDEERFHYNWIDKPGYEFETHVVNLAQGMKQPIVQYQLDKDPLHLKAVETALRDIRKYHGYPTGLWGGDELLHGNNPVHGTEFCAAVEMMFSLEKMIEIRGEVSWADQLEKIAYNVLPTMLSDDCLMKQYYHQVNQVMVTRHERNFTVDHQGTSVVFGLKSGYTCCTTNLHQGWPKLAAHLWMAAPEGGLAAIVYAPCRVTTTVGDGQKIEIIEKTNYPFGDKVELILQTENPVNFPLKLRIPGWTQSAQISINGKKLDSVTGNRFYEINQTLKNGDTITLEFDNPIRFERWHEGSVAIEKGPLVFALKIRENWKEIQNNDEFGDYREVLPESKWNYGLVRNHLQDLEKNFHLARKFSAFPKNPWTVDNAPIEIHCLGKEIPGWQIYNESAGPLPSSDRHRHQELGKEEPIVLIPFGCTTLRITEFPVVQ